MRWRTKRHGDIRERVIFAWLPYRCSDGFTRWLCRLSLQERFNDYPSTSWWAIISALPISRVSRRVRD